MDAELRRVLRRARWGERRCKVCGVPDRELGISHRGMCTACAMARVDAVVFSMTRKRGAFWERWKRNWVKGVEEVIRAYADTGRGREKVGR
jgi:hypothetical protein